jgi:hypothetical protein
VRGRSWTARSALADHPNTSPRRPVTTGSGPSLLMAYTTTSHVPGGISPTSVWSTPGATRTAAKSMFDLTHPVSMATPRGSAAVVATTAGSVAATTAGTVAGATAGTTASGRGDGNRRRRRDGRRWEGTLCTNQRGVCPSKRCRRCMPRLPPLLRSARAVVGSSSSQCPADPRQYASMACHGGAPSVGRAMGAGRSRGRHL